MDIPLLDATFLFLVAASHPLSSFHHPLPLLKKIYVRNKMSLKYYCDKCGIDIENVEQLDTDLCPKCYKEYKKWLEDYKKC